MNIEHARKRFREKNYICFTCDLDWAPEPAIDRTLKLFYLNKIRPTIFITHPSNIIDKYKDKADFGIHPNFIYPSSQGNSITEIIDYCVKIVPDTKVFRAHRWFASNDIYDELTQRGFLYESNICTDMDLVDPFIQRSGMISFPVFFEDGAYIIHHNEFNFSHIRDNFLVDGLKIINIHPMHYALNTPFFQYTRKIKDQLTRREWNEMDEEKIMEFKFKGDGIANFIHDLIDFSLNENIEIITLEQAYKMCIRELNK